MPLLLPGFDGWTVSLMSGKRDTGMITSSWKRQSRAKAASTALESRSTSPSVSAGTTKGFAKKDMASLAHADLGILHPVKPQQKLADLFGQGFPIRLIGLLRPTVDQIGHRDPQIAESVSRISREISAAAIGSSPQMPT